MRILFLLKDIKMQHVGVMLLAAILGGEGGEVEVVEAEEKKVARRLADGRRTILAYSTPTVFYRYYWDLNRRLRQRFGGQAFSVFGGPHATFSPEIIEHEGIDGVCIGEGDEAFPELVRALANGEDIRHIRNWWIKQDGEIYRNPLRPLIQDLDSLPFPDRSVFDDKAAFFHHRAAVLTGRGCPFNCTYCFNHAYKELYGHQAARIRRRSVPNVMEELRQVQADPRVRCVVFEDDNFTVDAAWIDELMDAYAREIQLPFFVKVHANFITEQTASALGRAGCACAAMGIETANERLRREILGRNIQTEQIVEAADLLHKHGVRVQSFNMIGLPTGTLENDFETLDLNVRCKVDYAEATMLNPYPKTRIYEITRERGLLPERFDGWEDPRNPSVNVVSHIRFPSAKARRRVENLHKLFGYAVEFPRLRPLVRRLIDLPRNPVYNYALLAYRTYCAYFRTMPVGFTGFLRRVAAGRWRWKHYS